MLNINFINEEELIKIKHIPWPMKDAKEVWEAIYNLTIKEIPNFVKLIENPISLIKPGHPTKLESIARSVLFAMSASQRQVAYKTITRKVNGYNNYMKAVEENKYGFNKN